MTGPVFSTSDIKAPHGEQAPGVRVDLHEALVNTNFLLGREGNFLPHFILDQCTFIKVTLREKMVVETAVAVAIYSNMHGFKKIVEQFMK